MHAHKYNPKHTHTTYISISCISINTCIYKHTITIHKHTCTCVHKMCETHIKLTGLRAHRKPSTAQSGYGVDLSIAQWVGPVGPLSGSAAAATACTVSSYQRWWAVAGPWVAPGWPQGQSALSSSMFYSRVETEKGRERGGGKTKTWRTRFWVKMKNKPGAGK